MIYFRKRQYYPIQFLLLITLLLLIPPSSFSQSNGKFNVAVMDLDMASGIAESYKQTLSDRLRSELFITGRFTVVERKAMIEILTEQGLQMTGCTSNECAVEAGKMLGVERMIAGSIGKVGRTYSINIRMIDVELGVILDTRNVDFQGDIEEVLSSQLRLAARLIAGLSGDGLVSGQQTTETAGRGDLYIKSNPEGARVYLDDSRVDGATPLVVERLAAGVHAIRLEKDNLIGSGTVFVAPGEMARVELDLEPGYASLRIYSTPFEAQIELDGEVIGSTPQTVNNLVAGTHTVVLSHPGYLNHDESVLLRIGDEKRIDIRMRRAIGEIVINSNVPFGTVTLNGNTESIKLPVTYSDLEFGIHQVIVEAADHNSYNQDVYVNAIQTFKVESLLEPHAGRIELSGLPLATDVFIDQEFIGTTPMNDQELRIGTYDLKLRKSGYEKGSTQQLSIKHSQVISAMFNLSPQSKSTSLKRSALWPGSGQFYVERRTAGWIYSVGEAVALGYLVYAITDHNTKADDYNTARDAYNSAITSIDISSTYIAAESAQNDAQSAESKVLAAAGIAGGLYIWNLVDAFLYNQVGVSLSDNQISSSDQLQFGLIPIRNPKRNSSVGITLGVTFGKTGGIEQ
jgi:TolB-like protein